jgi:hypothetical protein
MNIKFPLLFFAIPFRKLSLVFLASSPLLTYAQTNPYVSYLNSYYSTAKPLPAMPSPVTDAWVCRSVANDMWQRTWAITDSRSTISVSMRTTLLDQVHTEMNYLMNAQVNGRWWWSGSGRVGDSNTDRFVLAPLLEALAALIQKQLFISETSGWLNTVAPGVSYQYANYPLASIAGQYPNMDAAYALIMARAGVLYNNANYTQSGRSFVRAIAQNVLPGGGLRYIGSPTFTNPGAAYTLLTINYLSRYWRATADTAARGILVAMAPYLPTAWVAPGIAEGTSGPWWKHSIPRADNAGYFEIAAGLTGDSENRYFAERLIALNRVSPYDAILAADFWQPGIQAISPVDMSMFSDGDIGGVRGRFGEFSWVGTLGTNQDAFAGALVTTSNYTSNSSLESVGTDGLPSGYSVSYANGNPVIAMDASVFHSGGKSLKITCTPADRGEMVPPTFLLVPGHTYRVNLWYRSGGSIANNAIRSRFSSGAPWQLAWVKSTTGGTAQLGGDGTLHLIASQVSPNGWTLLGMTFQAPAGVTTLRMENFNWYGNGTVWYDDISFEDLSTSGESVAFDSSLLSVTPDVGIGTYNPSGLAACAAYASGLSYPKSAMTAATQEFSTVSAQYRPRQPRNIVPPETAETNWQVNQEWLFLPEHVIGRVKMTSLTAHADPWVRLRVRTEPGGQLYPRGINAFNTGGLNLNLLANNFPVVRVGCADVSDLAGVFRDADELFLEEQSLQAGVPSSHSYAFGQKYDVALSAQPATAVDPTGYAPLDAGAFSGFRATAGLNTYDVWCNTSVSSATLLYTLPATSLQTISTLYVTGTSTGVVAPSSGISGASVNRMIPAGATACVVRSRNLLFNGGFEYINAATNRPQSFNCFAAGGSPTIVADQNVSHTGYVSLKMTGSGSDRANASAPAISNVAGKKYQATLWYQTGGSIAADAVLIRLMAWKNAGSAETDKIPWQRSWITSSSGATAQISGNNLHVKASQTSPGQWRQMSITFTLPPTVNNRLSIEFFNWYGKGTVWYDDVSLVNMP